MRLPRVRFTMRRMMVLVAVTGLAMGVATWGLKMRRLARHYASQAQENLFFENLYRQAEASSLGRVREIV